MLSWSGRIVDALVEYKRLGILDFDTAWDLAVDELPPRGRDLGPTVLVLFEGEDQEQSETLESIAAFTERACRQAWNNECPVLRHLLGIRDFFDGDDSRAAVGRGGRTSRAA